MCTTGDRLTRDRVDGLCLGGMCGLTVVRSLRRLIVVLVSIIGRFRSCTKVCWWPATVHDLLSNRSRARQSRIQIQLRLWFVNTKAREIAFERILLLQESEIIAGGIVR